MRLKPGVSLTDLQPQMVLASRIIENVFLEWGEPNLEITSGNDGTHAGRPVVGGTSDPHYEGLALDYSIHGVLPGSRRSLVGALQDALGTQFVVLWEDQGSTNEHVHVQFGHIA